MTVASEFYNWQRSKLNHTKAPWNTCAPSLTALSRYLIARWGGQSLGCHHDREITGGGSVSSHAFGAALDWRYENPGVGRERALQEIIPFLIENSKELGIQAIHDYFGSRIWRANRAGDENNGWKDQRKGSQMGQAWATYLHIEVNKAQWADGRSVEERLGATPEPQIEWPPFNPARGEFGLYPLNNKKPTIRLNSRGDIVSYLQGVLRKNRYHIAVDGAFGRQTRDRVIRFQRANGLLPDGVVGPKTWAKIDRKS